MYYRFSSLHSLFDGISKVSNWRKRGYLDWYSKCYSSSFLQNHSLILTYRSKQWPRSDKISETDTSEFWTHSSPNIVRCWCCRQYRRKVRYWITKTWCTISCNTASWGTRYALEHHICLLYAWKPAIILQMGRRRGTFESMIGRWSYSNATQQYHVTRRQDSAVNETVAWDWFFRDRVRYSVGIRFAFDGSIWHLGSWMPGTRIHLTRNILDLPPSQRKVRMRRKELIWHTIVQLNILYIHAFRR